MRHLSRRLLPIALASIVMVSFAPTAAAADMTVEQAEGYVITLLNQQRAALGLVPLRFDGRVRNVARARSADMAKYHYFSHTNSDGRMAWDMMTDAGITWYWSGEIIAWNTWGTLKESAEAASRGWRNSAPHYALVTSKEYNYIGVGYAYDAYLGRKLWTAVFLKGPDRTGAWARMSSSSTGGLSGSSRYVSLRWTGADIRLQVLTSGLYRFVVQKRMDGGTWQTPWTTTTWGWNGWLPKGHKWDYRVVARDRAGNYGGWSTTLSFRT